MKKSLVFVFASVALSACGGTIEAEEPSTLQSIEQKQEFACPSSCACGNNCGKWVCAQTWNSTEWRTQWTMLAYDCHTNSVQCEQAGDAIRCAEPCQNGMVYAQPCALM
jgi:hypothetical protein